MRRGNWAVAGCACGMLVACGGGAHTEVTLTPTTPTAISTNPVATARSVRWVDLRPGECPADPPPSDPTEVIVTVADCAGPHRAETSLRAPIPVGAALTEVGNQRCNAGLAAYSGGGPCTIAYLIDSEQDRTSNNPYPSTVICLLQSADGRTLIGSARR